MSIVKGKKGLIMGVANDRSIAWGIAKKLSENGAELAFTYLGDTLKKRVTPLAESINSKFLLNCNVENKEDILKTFHEIKNEWGQLDFVVHAIAFSDRAELTGEYINTSRENFTKSMLISCFSFTQILRIFEPLLTGNSSVLTLTYGGSERVIPNYNVMGVAKAALESSVRYLASDLGDKGIRVNALSSGMMRTLAGSAVNGSRDMFKFAEKHKPLKYDLTLENIGSSGLYLLSDLSAGVTGEVHYVDQGYNTIGMPKIKDL